MLKFTKEHEWVRIEGDVAIFGITDHAQEQLGDIVFVELPPPGKVLVQGAAAAVVESVKAASDVYAPVSGNVVEVNQALLESPQLVNQDPMGAGWFVKVKMDDAAQVEGLMDENAYRSSLNQ